MNKARLDWIMSGLNQYTLSKTEDQFVRTALEHFEERHTLTEFQEERLEFLYKEKSKRLPNKKYDYFALQKNPPQKTRVRMPRKKVF